MTSSEAVLKCLNAMSNGSRCLSNVIHIVDTTLFLNRL